MLSLGPLVRGMAVSTVPGNAADVPGSWDPFSYFEGVPQLMNNIRLPIVMCLGVCCLKSPFGGTSLFNAFLPSLSG